MSQGSAHEMQERQATQRFPSIWQRILYYRSPADGLGRMAATTSLSRTQSHRRQQRTARARSDDRRSRSRNGCDRRSLKRRTNERSRRKSECARPLRCRHSQRRVGYQSPRRVATEDGLPLEFAVNTLAPYVLTALIQRPKRLVYLSSGLQQNGDPSLEDLAWERRQWRGTQAYSDTKLHDVMIAFAIARRWPDAFSNALEPGWVATKMGGAHAPDNQNEGHRTQVWLAVSSDPAAKVTGQYFYHRVLREPICGVARCEQAGQTHCRSRGFLWYENFLSQTRFAND